MSVEDAMSFPETAEEKMLFKDISRLKTQLSEATKKIKRYEILVRMMKQSKYDAVQRYLRDWEEETSGKLEPERT